MHPASSPSCGAGGEGTWKVDFLAKYVRPDQVDGRYLPELTGQAAVWKWHPTRGDGATA
jgi:hypothetical protein